MSKAQLPKALLEKIRLVTGRRSRVVVDHILQHGTITTEDLENYGYKHPPRAIRDVREQGVALEMFWTQNSGGRKIAGYRFGDARQIKHDRLGGRRVLSKVFHEQICASTGGRCSICRAAYEPRYLQTDHRVPYEVAGEATSREVAEFMPLCGSCNRAKSWSCEHCENWTKLKAPSVCAGCYWASPEDYRHVAMLEIRRLDVVWQGDEVRHYDEIAAAALQADQSVPDYVKHALQFLHRVNHDS